MKTTDKFVNDVIDGFQKARGQAYVYCFPPLTYIEAIAKVYEKFCNKWATAKTLIVTDTYDTRLKIKSFLDEHKSITCLTSNYIGMQYHYEYNLAIFIDVDDITKINHVDGTFKLLIYTRDNMDNNLKTFLNSKFKQIVTTVTANAARVDLIYSPVKETRIGVTLVDKNRTEYNEKDNYITECMKIFGDLDTIEKCKHGDITNNISAVEFRDTIARNNGWSDQLDMSIDYLKEIDRYYNPNSLYERACNFYRIRAEREQQVLNYELKIDAVLDIVRNNLNKKILIVSKTGELANNISEIINKTFGNICDCYHNEIEDRIAVDENGVAIRYKSGANKGKVKVIKSQAISTLTNEMYNNNIINILSIKNSSDVKLDCNCDIMIITSPLCDCIFELKTRFRNVRFNNSPNETYMIYVNNSIESKKLFERKINPLIKVIDDTEKSLVYDKNSNEIIL